jgi:hypothetical protein
MGGKSLFLGPIFLGIGFLERSAIVVLLFGQVSLYAIAIDQSRELVAT